MDRLPFAGFSLSAAGPLYARRFEERSRNLALDFAQSRALLALAENEGVTQQRLSELTAIASPLAGSHPRPAGNSRTCGAASSPCGSPGAISGNNGGGQGGPAVAPEHHWRIAARGADRPFH